MAILLVLCAHMAVPGMLGAGALGVTLFFVLSGFLITTLLLEELAKRGSLDVRRFYERRARRLLPALLASTAVVALLTPVFGALWLDWHALPSVLLYYANWVGEAQLGALGGTWSLSVEEQFYVLWPLILGVLARRGHKTVYFVAVAGMCVSLASRLYLIGTGTALERMYRGTDSVAFALLAGAALAARQVRRPLRAPSPRWLLVVVVLLVAPLQWSYWSTHAFGPLAAAVAGLLLVSAAIAPAPTRVLESRVLVWFGTRSYGLYLWHVPIGFLLREGVAWPWTSIVPVMLPLSLLLAELSYRCIEEPWRRRGVVTPPAAPRAAEDVAPGLAT